jgi:hypothetical protein
LLTRLGFLKGTLSDDRNVEALVVLRRLAVLSVPLKEGDLAFCADENGGNSYRVMQRGAGSDAKSIARIVS